MSHPWFASQRYRLAPAPGGLGLVQDFLNTVGIGDYGPDLLADPELAREWAAEAARNWAAERGVTAPPPTLTDADVAKLYSLRDTIARLLTGDAPELAIGSISASFTLSPTGQVRLEPVGSGWRWFASALWAEVLQSQWDGTWPRLKRCRNHQCASTFYDRSKNNSGVWHNVKTCGNAANLRASRARKRERAEEGAR